MEEAMLVEEEVFVVDMNKSEIHEGMNVEIREDVKEEDIAEYRGYQGTIKEISRTPSDEYPFRVRFPHQKSQMDFARKEFNVIDLCE